MAEEVTLYSIHIDGEILTDHNGSVIFSSTNPIFTHLPFEVQCLATLRNFVLNTVDEQQTKRVKTIYYIYPMDEDDTFIFKRYRLRQEDDVRLIQKWHHHFPTIILLKLLVVLVDIGGSSALEVGLDTQSSGAARTNIRRLMVDLNMPLEGSIHDSNPEINEPTEGNDEEDFESHERSMHVILQCTLITLILMVRRLKLSL
ncbi:hypothetical protein PIB30_049459 [Stylosanthes scabra]|uniref:Uncharacterized protein n=1 Tax=Stylosanthes scabra TaxID=79078 RepID=A0ABU6WFJ9_9FABA|nr:hypothetical protein [Stylosanthes scabra]